MEPKGTILIIGGAEDKGGDDCPDIKATNKQFIDFEILKALLPGKKTGRLEVVTTASGIPDEICKMYKKAFGKIGYTNVGYINIADKIEARKEKFTERIKKAHAVFFSGGDQLKILTTLGGTPFIDALYERYKHDQHFVLAGTSAGAMALSEIMICAGGSEETAFKNDLKMAAGFGFLPDCIVDTHFIRRGRFNRLAHSVMINPGQLGIGLGEDTCLIIQQGHKAVCRGSGMAVIIDGKDMGQTNINETPEGTPPFAENLRVHFLTEGCRFSLKKRAFEIPAIQKNKQKEM